MDLIAHYDMLIDENNDPFRDPLPLQEHMSKWDGKAFIDSMCLSERENVLEIGVGTGRLASKILPQCRHFVGIDISPKTIDRARENLAAYSHVSLICDDFLKHSFDTTFDIVYSSLTMLHFKDKQSFIDKVASLLKVGGKFVLSIDKSQSSYIDMGTRKILVYPDTPINTAACISAAKMKIISQFETEFAHVFVSVKNDISC